MGRARHAIACLLAFGQGSPSPPPTILFSDASREAALSYRNVCGTPAKTTILEANGNGAALADFDGDGDLDLFLPQGTTLEAFNRGEGAACFLYRNGGNGRFEDVSASAGLVQKGWWTGAASADFDGDGDVDVYVTAFGRNALLRNESFRFEDVAPGAGVDAGGWGTSAAWLDLDLDGLLDLYVVNYLEFDPRNPPKGSIEKIPCRWKDREVFCGPHGFRASADRVFRNLGDGRFADVSVECGARSVAPGYGLGVVAADLDLDGDDEVYVANDSTANFLFRNDGGRLVEVGFESGVAFSETGTAQAGMGTDAGDFDGDGLPDLVVTNFSDEPTTLYRNLGSLLFDNATYSTGLGAPTLASLSWGVSWIDFDLDGDLDLFAASGHVYPQADGPDTGTSYRQRNQLFENVAAASGRRFVEIRPDPSSGLALVKGSRGTTSGDLDDDGDTDLVVVEIDEAATVLRNETRGNGRLVLELVGVRSNRDALGALVRLEAGGAAQIREVRRNASFQSSNDPRLVFGLGPVREASRVEVRWPSGRADVAGPLQAGRRYRLLEGVGVVEEKTLP